MRDTDEARGTKDAMSHLEDALRRLDHAVGLLEHSLPETGGLRPARDGDEEETTAALRAERDRLAGEVRALRGRAAEDARLRAEAARAVREALHDLRGAVGDRHVEVRRNA